MRMPGPRALFDVGVVLVYVALGLVAFAPLWPWTSTRLYGTFGDPVLGDWFLAWVPHALTHGIDPFFTNALSAPHGVNLAGNTSTPLLGILTAPLAPLLSPVERGNFVMILALPVSATAAYFVLRRWAVWAPAAAIGGLVFGFSPFQISEALGHLFLVFLPFPPLIAFTLASILGRRGRPIRLGLLLGLLLAAQFLVSAEVFVMCVVLSALVLGTVALRHPAQVVEQCRMVFKPIAIAAVVVAVIIAFPVWMFLLGPRHYTGPAQSMVNPYYNDLLSFIHPSSMQKLSLGLRGLRVPLPGNASEAGGYIGIPLLILAIGLAWRSRRTSRMQVAGLVTLWAAILSLGSHLTIAGHSTHIPLPFDVVRRVPFFDSVLPSRFSFATALGLAAMLAFGIDDIRRYPRHATDRQAAVVGVVVLVALVVTQLPAWPYKSQPVRELPAEIRAAIPTGNPIAVTYPYPWGHAPEAEVWQMQDGFSFRLMGGYVIKPDAKGNATFVPTLTNPPDLGRYLWYMELGVRQPPTSTVVSATRTALANDDVRMVVVDRSAPGGSLAMTLFEQALGLPKVVAGSFALWSNSQNPFVEPSPSLRRRASPGLVHRRFGRTGRAVLISPTMLRERKEVRHDS